MRIVVLTHSAERHYYFANQIICRTQKVVGVITDAKKTGAKKAPPLKKKILDYLFRSYRQQLAAEKDHEELRLFAGSRSYFLKKHQHLLIAQVNGAHGSINHPYYIELIRKAKPKVIVVMGTCLLGREIIDSAPQVINLHTGLSPYYRGGKH